MSYIDHLCRVCNHRLCDHEGDRAPSCKCCRAKGGKSPDYGPPVVLPSWDFETRDLEPLKRPGELHAGRRLHACDECVALFEKETE